MLAGDQRQPATPPTPDAIRAAFRDLHGRRLHGFALLLTLGDRAVAARLAAEALAAGALRVGELRHPERAAAWLRARVVRRQGRRTGTPSASSRATGELVDLGADEAVIGGLAVLRPRERAALIAATIEGLDRRDVAVIVGREGRTLDRMLERARLRYADAGAAARAGMGTEGPIARRIHEVAQRAMG